MVDSAAATSSGANQATTDGTQSANVAIQRW
jgi:hypothetical protein